MTMQRATRFCCSSYRNAPRDHGMEKDALSISMTSSRSSGRMRSSESDSTTLQLRFRGAEVERCERGGIDRVATAEPCRAQDADRGGRRDAGDGGHHAGVHRDDAGGAIADQDRRTLQPLTQRLRGEGEVVPLSLNI